MTDNSKPEKNSVHGRRAVAYIVLILLYLVLYPVHQRNPQQL